MYHPTTRVLTVLELLQSHAEMTGGEIARRLEVDPRTVRRYITMLQDLGIPVEAERGRHGAYRLRPGFKLPPLMFTEDEALAVTLGLRIAQRAGLSASTASVEGALAKLERVMPETLREQLQDVDASLIIELAQPAGIAAPEGVIAALSNAIRATYQVKLNYQAYEGETSTRIFDPYGLVYRVGRWYVVGYCHLRAETRTFRLDRVQRVERLNTRFTRPVAFDALLHVEQSLANTPGQYRVEVLFDAPLEAVQQQVPVALGTLTEQPNGIRLVCEVQRLSWIAGYLAGLTLPITILHPDDLKIEMRRLVERVQSMAG
jgi:predicted DNA-binding transcriptional regulator YafY